MAGTPSTSALVIGQYIFVRRHWYTRVQGWSSRRIWTTPVVRMGRWRVVRLVKSLMCRIKWISLLSIAASTNRNTLHLSILTTGISRNLLDDHPWTRVFQWRLTKMYCPITRALVKGVPAICTSRFLCMCIYVCVLCEYVCACCVSICVHVCACCLYVSVCDDCVPLIMQVSIKFTHTHKYSDKHKNGLSIINHRLNSTSTD